MASFVLAPITVDSDVSTYHTFLSSIGGYDSPDDTLLGPMANSSYNIPFHDPLPGCAQPYQLPAGTSTCPVPGCRGYGNKFKPYWRLNEHMKARHGWPRKNTQPLLDKRINGKSAKFKTNYNAPSSAAPRSPPLHSILKQPQPISLTPVSSASHTQARERKDFLSAAEKRSLEDWMAGQPEEDDNDQDIPIPDAPVLYHPLDASSAHHHPDDPSDHDVPPPFVPAIDDAMCAEAEAYIAWLDAQKPLHPSQNAVRAVLAQLAARKLFRTGQVLPARVHSSMLALYRILETRAGDVVSQASSLP